MGNSLPCPHCGSSNTYPSGEGLRCLMCGCAFLSDEVQRGEQIIMSKWKSIDSSPRDGTQILGYWYYRYPGDSSVTEGMSIIWFESGYWTDGDESHLESTFTHWMPLPAPPEEAQNNE